MSDCPRCNGLLVPITVSVLGQAMPEYSGLKCLICGFYGDELTIQNRLHPPDPAKDRGRVDGRGRHPCEGCGTLTYNKHFHNMQCQRDNTLSMRIRDMHHCVVCKKTTVNAWTCGEECRREALRRGLHMKQKKPATWADHMGALK